MQDEARRNRKGFHSIDMHRSDDDDEDPNLAFEMEQQQQLISKQDNTLDLIGSTLTSLKRQAGNLGQEIGEQVELIGALDGEVDTSQSKLSRAMGRMDELVRRSDDRLGGWCVWLLVLVSAGRREDGSMQADLMPPTAPLWPPPRRHSHIEVVTVSPATSLTLSRGVVGLSSV